MIGAKSFWWALASIPLMIVGALSSWAQTLGVRVDGSQDEVVLVLAIVAGFALLPLAASWRRWLVVVPLIAKTFVDIGANNGTTSLAALSAGFSSVVACEPGPEAFSRFAPTSCSTMSTTP